MYCNYLKSVVQEIEYYKMLGEKTFSQLTDEQLFWQSNSESNSIGVIVKHLWGNMMSRWTNFLTSDGEKDWRDRDAEFINDLGNRNEIIHKWNEGWNCFIDAINSLSEADLEKEVIIRNQRHSVMEAINRQLAHYSYHIGQIVFIGKMICFTNWRSLTIPKGNSKQFNTEMFSTKSMQIYSLEPENNK